MVGKLDISQKPKIAEHCWNEDYRIQWDKAEIIHKKDNKITRKLKKSVFIGRTACVVCKPSLDVSSIWPPLL
jgi:hypothetical protein